MKLVIQIPCLNESGTLASVLAELPNRIDGFNSIETLVIDDGSSDGTAATALALGVDHVVRHNVNRGLAASFASGFEASRALNADIVVNTDGDHQYPSSAIESLIRPILSGQTDLVVGDRCPSSDRRLSRMKRCLHWLGRRVISRLAGQDLPDPVSGFRAYSREAIRRTHLVTQYSYTIESLLQAANKGLAIRFVPVTTNAPTRPSRLFRSWPQFVSRSALTALRVFFMYHSLGVFAGVSLVLAILGLLPILRFIGFYSMGYGNGHLQSLVLGGTLIVLAAITLVAGMIADLIAHNRRLLEETLERHDRFQPSSDQADPRRVGFSEFRLRSRVDSGFTLIELLVSMAIISVLTAMLLPAVQSVRESARRMQCSDHLRQLSLAMLQHESNHRHLPSGGWSKEWSGVPGLGSGPTQPGGWIYQILPLIEQSAVYDLGGKDVTGMPGNGERLQSPLPILHCPSRRGAELFTNQRNWHPRLHPQPLQVARNDYAANGGGRLIPFGDGPPSLAAAKSFAWPSMKDSTGICFQRSRVQLRDVTDGLSQTILLGEKHLPFTHYVDGKDRGDNEGAYSGDDRDTLRYVGTLVDTRYQPFSDAFLAGVEGAIFGSAHAPGFHLSMCDGSVRMVHYSIDLQVYASLGSRNDGRTIDGEAFSD